MGTQHRTLAEGAAGPRPESYPDPRQRARGYERLNVGLVLLALDDPARPGRWQGVPDLLDHLFREGIPCVVGTPGRRQALVAWLERIGCAARLPMRISREDLGPDPGLSAVTMLACSRLAMPPRHTLVVADGPRCAAGGAAAGSTVIAVGTPAAQATLRRTGADHGVDDLAVLVPVAIWNTMDGARLHGG